MQVPSTTTRTETLMTLWKISITHYQKLMTVIHTKDCIITGDINIDLMEHETHDATNSYLGTMLCNEFMPTILLPTRVTSNTCTLIDHWSPYSCKDRRTCLRRCCKDDFKVLSKLIPNISYEISMSVIISTI